MTDPIVEVLTRVAVALEKLVASQDCSKDGTPFPWNQVSGRVRIRVRYAVENFGLRDFANMTWPLTCEDLVDIGFRHFTESFIRGIGVQAGLEIATKLDELGFKHWQDT
jgi:hypothetical protein